MATKKSATAAVAGKASAKATAASTKRAAAAPPAKKAVAKAASTKTATAKAASAKKAAPPKPAAASKKSPAASKKATAGKAPAKATAKVTPAKSAPQSAPAKKAAGTPAKAPAKKAVTKSPFDAKFLAAQKELLLSERVAHLRQADALQEEADSLMADREPGDVQFDEESGEGDTLAVERERDLALSAQARAAVEQIDAALVRIAEGTYGICRVSGQPIPKERLKAIPWATERVEFKVGGFARL